MASVSHINNNGDDNKIEEDEQNSSSLFAGIFNTEIEMISGDHGFGWREREDSSGDQ